MLQMVAAVISAVEPFQQHVSVLQVSKLDLKPARSSVVPPRRVLVSFGWQAGRQVEGWTRPCCCC